MPHPDAYTNKDQFFEGDVVYAPGSSAILGDVVKVDSEGVHIAWRGTTTVEQPYDLTLSLESKPHLRPQRDPV